MDKENKRVVLVTGAYSGIGLACATHLAGRGYRVFGTSRRAATGQARSVAMLVADVTDDHSVEQAVAAVLEREGRLDIVVNNAGMGIAGPVENTATEAAMRQLEVNFFGAFRVCRAVLPVMRSQGAATS
jgi:NAD(P)-dependent dehydrogenase (short-subunit alcohol dehydrogenase family)